MAARPARSHPRPALGAAVVSSLEALPPGASSVRCGWRLATRLLRLSEDRDRGLVRRRRHPRDRAVRRVERLDRREFRRRRKPVHALLVARPPGRPARGPTAQLPTNRRPPEADPSLGRAAASHDPDTPAVADPPTDIHGELRDGPAVSVLSGKPARKLSLRADHRLLLRRRQRADADGALRLELQSRRDKPARRKE